MAAVTVTFVLLDNFIDSRTTAWAAAAVAAGKVKTEAANSIQLLLDMKRWSQIDLLNSLLYEIHRQEWREMKTKKTIASSNDGHTHTHIFEWINHQEKMKI